MLDLSYNPSDTLFIDTDIDFNDFMYLTQPIVASNNAIITIRNKTNCLGDGTITLTEGAQLIVDGGTLSKISIIDNDGAKFVVRNQSRVEISKENKNAVTLHR